MWCFLLKSIEGCDPTQTVHGAVQVEGSRTESVGCSRQKEVRAERVRMKAGRAGKLKKKALRPRPAGRRDRGLMESLKMLKAYSNVLKKVEPVCFHTCASASAAWPAIHWWAIADLF